jgi:flagellar hook assembly protein FlgD
MHKQHKKAIEDLVSEALKIFLDMSNKNDKLVYTKKDSTKHLHKIEYNDDGEDLSDVKLYSNIEDVAQYVHNLRRIKK